MPVTVAFSVPESIKVFCEVQNNSMCKIIIFEEIFHTLYNIFQVCTIINFQHYPLYVSLIRACTII